MTLRQHLENIRLHLDPCLRCNPSRGLTDAERKGLGSECLLEGVNTMHPVHDGNHPFHISHNNNPRENVGLFFSLHTTTLCARWRWVTLGLCLLVSFLSRATFRKQKEKNKKKNTPTPVACTQLAYFELLFPVKIVTRE